MEYRQRLRKHALVISGLSTGLTISLFMAGIVLDEPQLVLVGFLFAIVGAAFFVLGAGGKIEGEGQRK